MSLAERVVYSKLAGPPTGQTPPPGRPQLSIPNNLPPECYVREHRPCRNECQRAIQISRVLGFQKA
jgi:hypothetical protein